MLNYIKRLFKRKLPNHIHWYKPYAYESTLGYHNNLVKIWKCNCGEICNLKERNKYANYVSSLNLSYQDQKNYNILWPHEYK